MVCLNFFFLCSLSFHWFHNAKTKYIIKDYFTEVFNNECITNVICDIRVHNE